MYLLVGGMIKHFAIAFLMAIIGFAAYMVWHLGAFKPVEITEGEFGPFQIVFLEHQGPYHKIVASIEKVESWARTQGLDCTKTFGRYFDDPALVEEARLRSQGGCLINNPPASLPPEFLTESIPAQYYVSAKFEGSPGIGPIKVYPKLHKYIQEKAYGFEMPITEIYEVHEGARSMTTSYFFPVNKLTHGN